VRVLTDETVSIYAHLTSQMYRYFFSLGDKEHERLDVSKKVAVETKQHRRRERNNLK